MQYRHEWKYEINALDQQILRQRLSAVMQRDTHTLGSIYTVRSLYFDTLSDKALREKTDGVNRREKFRIRLYNGDTTFIRLEKKYRENGLGYKVSARLTAAETQSIIDGDTAWMRTCDRPLCRELYSAMTCGLRPKTIVEYTREPFVFSAGNVRVTLDANIRTGLYSTDFLNPDAILIPAGDVPAILEVKWDNFLPDIVRDAVGLTGRHTSAFSKYAQCRIYG